jgi:hypothetical protein
MHALYKQNWLMIHEVPWMSCDGSFLKGLPDNSITCRQELSGTDPGIGTNNRHEFWEFALHEAIEALEGFEPEHTEPEKEWWK